MKINRRIIWPLFLGIAVACSLAISSSLRAQTQYRWTGSASQNWFDAENWDPAGAPGTGDGVSISSAYPHPTLLTGADSQQIGPLVVGGSGAGFLSVRGGLSLLTEGGGIGSQPSSSGTVHLHGPSTSWVFLDDYGPMFIVGYGGAGNLIIEDGARMGAATQGIVGHHQGSVGSVSIRSKSAEAPSSWTFGGGAGEGHVIIGDAGGGFVTVGDNGRFSLGRGGSVRLGNKTGGLGVVTIAGENAEWWSTSLNTGISGTGILTVADGGTANVGFRGNATPVALATRAGSTGILNIGSGEAPGHLNGSEVQGKEGNATLNFNHDASAHRFENSEGNPVLITGSTKLNHIGSGTTILGGENTYTGDTTISNGTLVVNGSAANSAFTVDSGGTLGGFGTVGKLYLGSGGFLSPGESAGTLHVAGDFSWTAGGVAVFELGPDAAGSDFIDIAGEFLKDGDGEWAFDFVAAGWIVGHTYDLAQFLQTDFEVGDFSFRNPGPFDGDFALEENRLRFTLTEVPEPSAYGLLIGLGAVILLALRRPGIGT